MWDLVVGIEPERAALKHQGGEIAHDRLGLEMEVAKHLIRPPTSQKANHVGVDVSTQEGHCASGTEAACGDIRGKKAKVAWAEGNDGDAEGVSDVGGGDLAPGGALKVQAEGRVGRGTRAAEVNDAAGEGKDGAELGVAGAGKANDLAPDAVFLGGKGEAAKGGGKKFGVGGSGEIKAGEANKELDIRQLKGSGVGGRGSAFAGAQEEEKGQGDHVSDGQVAGKGTRKGREKNVVDHGDGDGLDAVRGRILLLVETDLAGNAEIHLPALPVAWIRGPHCSERLANAA